MKKTLIALMALAGVSAAEDWTAKFTSTEQSTSQSWNNYSAVFDTDALTLSFTNLTISDGTKNGAYSSGSPGNQFNTAVRPNANVCHGSSPASYTLSFKIYNKSDKQIVIDAITLDTFLYDRWGNGHNYGNFASTALTCTIAFGDNLSTAFSTTYECDANVLKDTNGTQNVEFSFGDKSIILNTGEHCNFAVTFEKDKGNGSFVGLNGATFTGQLVPAAVPEPTTATLSLLALAGLAARRRRK